MGRRKIHPENKASGTSISLSPKHKKMLEEMSKETDKKRSDIIQELIEREFEAIYSNIVAKKG
jgi:predicted DNA-binding protein